MKVDHSSQSKSYKYFCKNVQLFLCGLTRFDSLIFIFFADIWKVKQIDTVECQKLVIDIVNSLVTDPRNTMTVGNYISPGNRLKFFCEEMFLYRDTDSFRNSCVAMCQFLLEKLHNSDVSREIGKEEMRSDIHLKLCNGDMDQFLV